MGGSVARGNGQRGQEARAAVAAGTYVEQSVFGAGLRLKGVEDEVQHAVGVEVKVADQRLVPGKRRVRCEQRQRWAAETARRSRAFGPP